jgi:hypothetical protein
MSHVSFKKGLRASLPTTYTAGTLYVTTDERAIYMDVDGSTRIRIGDFQEFATLEALQANTNPSTSALYYVEDINCLAKWTGTGYVQINRDTGMTSVEVTGTGNALTAAVYDATGRKLTLTKGATFVTADEVSAAIDTKVGTLGADYSTVKDYVDAKTSGIASDAALSALDGRVGDAESAISALQETVGDGGGVDTRISNAINALDKADTAVAGQYVSAVSEDNGVITVTRASLPDYSDTYDAKGAADTAETNAKAYADGKDDAISAAKKAGTDAMTEAKAKVASVTAGDASVTVGGTATAPTVAVAISNDDDNSLSLTEGGLKVVIPDAAEFSIAKDEDSGDYAAVYHLTKDGAKVGAAINIPKDMVVQSGSVVTLDAAGASSAGLTNAGTYIKLVLANATNDTLYIDVSGLIEYVTSGSATGDMVFITIDETTHKVTATITDGTITEAKLASAVTDKLGKAHTHDNKTVLDGITSTKVSAWDAAEQNAKDYADGLAKNYDASGAASTAESNAKSYADGLAENYDAAGSATTAESNAKSYADQKIQGLDKADTAVTGQYVSAVSEEDGVITVTRSALPDYSSTYDAKGAADTAEQNAKAYADGLVLEWGAF